MPKRQDPSDPTGLPYDFRIDRANIQRAEAQTDQTQNLDRTLMVERDGVMYRTALFSKTLPHNEFGEVSDDDWMRLEVALRSGEQAYFNRIRRASGAVRKLVDPQGALAFSLLGADAFSVVMPPAPSMESPVAAADMVEVYGMSILRDVSFRDLQDGTTGQESDVTLILNDLNSFGAFFNAPKIDGEVTRQTLFRGSTLGEVVGPYVSQFMLHDFNYGNLFIEQLVETESDTEDSVSVAEWLNIQRGITPPGANLTGERRRVFSPRVLASYVHNDPLAQAFFHACLILLGAGAPLNSNIPVLPNEVGFGTMGPPDIMARVFEVSQIALQTCWRHKWMVNMRLRPEVLAGRVHFTLAGGQEYNLDAGLLSAGIVPRILERNTLHGHPTYLLPLVYPEGSPAHPSYPAGHATVAGACATVLKAFFDTEVLMSSLAGGTFKIVESLTGTESMSELEDNAITNPDIVNQLTVGIELNKLASNIATGRNMAGVHYRTDGDQSVLLGEKIAIQYLKDVANTYNQPFDGFLLQKFDGTTITVK